MTFPTVDKFLCCCDLVTFGLFLGYIGAVSNAGCALAIIFDIFWDKEGFRREITDIADDFSDVSVFGGNEDESYLDEGKDYPEWEIAFISTMLLATFIVCAGISLIFIKGIKERNPHKVFYFLIIMAIGTCTTFLKGIFSLSFFWILTGMIYVYFFICVYSLYEILLQEDVDNVKCALKGEKRGYQEYRGE